MFQEFLQYIKDNNLFEIKNDKILLAVSGGIDSMVMMNLFSRLKCNYAIAHCNFNLRNEESLRDETFVTQYANTHNITLFKQNFDTYSYMDQNKLSLEMAARELRYNWFEQLIKEHHFTYVATAHHGDDSTETFLINLLRGTGIAGLHGILPKNNYVIRPMLFTTRRKIEQYASKHNIAYVEDSSNKDNSFTRNKLRNEIVPVLREISPNFDSIIRKNIERLRETEQVFRQVIDSVKQRILVNDNGIIHIELDKLKLLQPLHIYLYEILHEFGFNDTNINSICKLLDENNASGSQFFSEKYRLLIDRQQILITEKQQSNLESDTYILNDYHTYLTSPVKLHTEILNNLQYVKIPKQKNIAMLDYDKLKFPLIIRHWQKGDWFIPFGMYGKQKLSDFFSNNKYSILDKENQWLLCSGDNIIWVIGQRIDNRYRINNKTKTIFKLELD